MKSALLDLRKLSSAMFAAALLTACGGGSGGGGGSGPGPNDPSDPPGGGAPPPDTNLPTVMYCVDGESYQCSGDSIIRTDNGVAMTRSGVQAYGRSTSDLEPVIVEKTGAFGFELTSGGVAEIRLSKDANGAVSNPALLLSNLGLSWDGNTDRPQIIDPFLASQGRVTLDENGALVFSGLPPRSDLDFYNYASLGPAATQANYANNRYFPRDEPSRCSADMIPCRTVETEGISRTPGDWRSGGVQPDESFGIRVHGDGDIHAGDGPPDANGDPTVLPGGNGPGVPFPGSKGYRELTIWSYQYSNLASWLTQDTVLIEEWAALGNEHNKNRRGIVTFGDVTAPDAVPATGTATYSGRVLGRYASNADAEPDPFSGNATVTVDFATGEVSITVEGTRMNDGSSTPAEFTATAMAGVAGSDLANYMTGPVSNGTLTGGVGARYFGPVVTTGTGGAGPAELSGTFSLSNPATGQAVVGGFIALKQ